MAAINRWALHNGGVLYKGMMTIGGWAFVIGIGIGLVFVGSGGFKRRYRRGLL
jgi:hypothetical protein